MHPMKSLLRVGDLENRLAPAAIILNRPFVSNEIIALLRGSNPLEGRRVSEGNFLPSLMPRIAAIDESKSKVIFHSSDSTLMRVHLAAGSNPIDTANELANSTD